MTQEQEYEMREINSRLCNLAEHNNGQAQFTYGKDLLANLRVKGLDDKKQEREFQKYAYE